MDQIKIGRFIAVLRRERAMSQRELAEALCVSDKTVSKWECGRGLPDASLMLPLCELLGITVNELLSGERLSKDSYPAHAEENMAALLRERTENKRKLLLEVLVIALTLIPSTVMVMLAGLLELSVGQRVALLVLALFQMAGGIFVAAWMEMTSGYFECAHCGKYFTPTKGAYLRGMHTVTRRHLRCPHCGRVSWCRRRLSKK